MQSRRTAPLQWLLPRFPKHTCVMPAGGKPWRLMPRVPLEDNFDDIINKAQRGLHLTDAQLAQRAGVSTEDLLAVKSGRPIFAVIRRVARHLALSPDALEASAGKNWYPEQPAFPTGFAAFNTVYGDMTVNSYLIWDARTKLAAAFDTGASAGGLLDTVNAEGLTLRMIFITHSHEDHIADLSRLAGAGDVEVWASEREPVDFPGAKTFRENAHFHLGGLAIKTLLTSGHSPGQTTFYVTGLSWPLAIAGDSIFAGSLGGSPTHYAEQRRNTGRKILTLPRDTVLACGHGPLTTVRQELRHNPFFAP
jgi:glyoxylase-like metal-dependent hydrolase (beta-lactamase superfamily II)